MCVHFDALSLAMHGFIFFLQHFNVIYLVSNNLNLPVNISIIVIYIEEGRP